MAYNLNQLAMITGLTTRTLRNHLKAGVLTGEKIDGNWQFTEEALDDYIGQPNVRRAIAARQHAVIYDFLADAMKKTNRICVVMDFPVAAEAAMAIAAFFSREISDHGRDIEFRYINGPRCARFILAGAEEQVAALMKAYYERPSGSSSAQDSEYC